MAEALRARRAEASAGGNERARRLHQSRGQMLPRERIAALLDPGSPFFEIGQLTAADLYDGVPPGATLITGVGRVAGRDCMLIVNDPTVKGGTMFGMTTKRHVRAQMFAWQHRLPCITMVQSGGASPARPGQLIFPDDGQGGSVMYNQVKMSSEGIAQIALVFGPSTAGGAYIPALRRAGHRAQPGGHVPRQPAIGVRRHRGSDRLGGPGRRADALQPRGVADHLAEDDAHALAITRSLVRHLGEPAPLRWTRAAAEDPLYPASELRGLVRQARGDAAVDGREILARLVDGSRFQEFKPLHGETLRCAFARIEGFEVGIVAGHGALSAQAAAKGAHFVELCVQRDIPLVFLVDSPGFAGSDEPGQGGIGRHGAKLLNAVANADVPKFSVIVGQAFGAAYQALCGRAFKPNALLMWPNARAAASPAAHDDEACALNWARHLWCDAVVEPEHTRGVLAQLLDVAGRAPPAGAGVFRM